MNNANDMSEVTGMNQIAGFTQVGKINYIQLTIGNSRFYVHDALWITILQGIITSQVVPQAAQAHITLSATFGNAWTF